METLKFGMNLRVAIAAYRTALPPRHTGIAFCHLQRPLFSLDAEFDWTPQEEMFPSQP